MIGLARPLAKFWRDTRANIAIVFAFGATAMIGAVGGGIDYSRAVSVGAQVQSALDSGVLAASSLTQSRDPQAVVDSYVRAALADHPEYIEGMTLTVNSAVATNSRVVDAQLVIDVPTTLLGVVGINDMRIVRTASALEEARNIEISLVLDVSGSMNGSKISALRTAATEFVEVMLASNPELTSISVIPYNGGVRLPASVNDSLIGAGSQNERRQSGCPEIVFDNSWQLTQDGVFDDLRDALSGLRNQMIPTLVNLPRNEFAWLEWNGQDMKANRSSSFCPRDTAASVFLSENEGTLTNLISGLQAGGNTGLDIATTWGARALDPAWRGRIGGSFPDRPADYGDNETMKIMVVMTDGAVTPQYRTEEYRYRDRRGRWQDGWRWYEVYNTQQARTNMAAACDAAEDNGVHVYTIAFQLSGQIHRSLMENCASQPSNFYNVENLDISSAFSAIAASINSLRLSS